MHHIFDTEKKTSAEFVYIRPGEGDAASSSFGRRLGVFFL